VRFVIIAYRSPPTTTTRSIADPDGVVLVRANTHLAFGHGSTSVSARGWLSSRPASRSMRSPIRYAALSSSKRCAKTRPRHRGHTRLEIAGNR